MDYKEENKKAYNLYARKFEEKFKRHFEQHLQKEADLFLTHLQGKEIIDLGSGPGNHSVYFQERGCRVLCVDFSESMLQLCAEKGLDTKCMDIEQWNLPENSFDGIWAYASLLHVPKKKLPEVVENIRKTLKKEGIVGIAVKEGEGQGYDINEKYPETKRYFSYFYDEEIRELLENQFEIIFKSRRISGKSIFLHYLLKIKTKK